MTKEEAAKIFIMIKDAEGEPVDGLSLDEMIGAMSVLLDLAVKGEDIGILFK